MNKEKATRILAKELGDKVGRLVVLEDSYKDNLIKNASVVYQIDNPDLAGFYGDKFHDGKSSKEEIVELLLQYKGAFAEANYYFLESIPLIGDSKSPRSRFAVTPYALIGEKEEDDLKRLFYKDVHQDVVHALNVLGIENYVGLYECYGNPDLDFFSSLECLRFIDFVSRLSYDGDGEIQQDKFEENFGRDVDSLNVMFEKIGVEARISSKKDRKSMSADYIHKNNLLEVITSLKRKVKYVAYEGDFFNDFFSFVFSLPYEEQNIGSNKEILRKSENLGFVVDIACQEYSQGKHFQEYFDVLDKYLQGRIVESLKSVPIRNPVCDSFLWGRGFKDVELDYLDLYKKDADGFIEYFGGKNPEERKVILKDIMDCDFINEAIADWLNKNEPELVKEVGLNE